MLSRRSLLNLEAAQELKRLENSQFIQKVREQEFRGKIIEDVFLKSTRENPYHKKIESFIPLCNAIKEENRLQFLYHKRNQIRRQNNVDLRQLEYQLRAAYISKTIAAQKKEQEALKLDEDATVHLENYGLEQARIRQIVELKKEEKQKKIASLQSSLLEQMALTKDKRMKEKLNLMHEKKLMEDTVLKYKEDMEKEKRDSIEKKKKIRADIEAFRQANEDWKKAHAYPEIDEHATAMEFIRSREMDELNRQRAKVEMRNLKLKMSEKIGKQMHAKAEEKRKFDEVLTELLIDERKAKEEIRQAQEEERKRRERANVRIDLANYHAEKQRRKLELKKQKEVEFREGMQTYADYLKQNQLADEKKKIKTLEYRKALLDGFDEQKRMKSKEIKTSITEYMIDVNDQKRKQVEIENARSRMLEEHGPGIVKFLPPGALIPSDFNYMKLPTK